MEIVRRDGRWTLEREQAGVYAICEDGSVRARVLTDGHEPDGLLGAVLSDLDTETIEVPDFDAAVAAFEAHVARAGDGDEDSR